MKPVYEIKFLSSNDFDNLPVSETRGSDVSDSLGFYNPFTNRIFIRYSAYPQLNKYLLDHEFEHLIEDEPTDADRNGIRHKKGKKFFKEIFAPLFTGFNLETGKFSPLGILGDTSKQETQGPQVQEPQQGMNLSTGQMFGPGVQGLFGGQSQAGGEQESYASINKPNMSNPLTSALGDINPQYRYGAPSGRIYGF